MAERRRAEPDQAGERERLVTQVKCIDPGRVSPIDLVAFADGDAPDWLVQHVRGCSFCAAQVRDFARTERRLRGLFYRAECPSPQRLGEYDLNLLSPEDRLVVAAHVLDCPRCVDELRTLRGFMADDLDEALGANPLPRRIQRIIARFIPASPRAAYAGLRGAAHTSAQTFRAGDVTISMEWRPGSRAGLATLVGLVLSDIGTNVEEREIRLIRVADPSADGSPRTERTDDLGNVLFDDLPPGSYRLEVDLDDATIVVEGLSWTS